MISICHCAARSFLVGEDICGGGERTPSFSLTYHAIALCVVIRILRRHQTVRKLPK